MIDPLWKILDKEGELSMRYRWEKRIFPMLGKEGLKSKTKEINFFRLLSTGNKQILPRNRFGFLKLFFDLGRIITSVN